MILILSGLASPFVIIGGATDNALVEKVGETPNLSPASTPNPSPTPVPPPVISCAADLTFDTDGRVTTDFPGGPDGATAVAVQSDGKIVVAGDAGEDFALVRLNPDGTLDATFGTGGRVYTDFFLTFDQVNAIVIQPDGKIVVVGSTDVDPATGSDIENDFALARYNTDGSLDTTFGIGGRVTTDFDGKNDEALGVALQPDGRIVVAGGVGGVGGGGFSGFADVGLARYSTDGSLDTTFGVGGRVTTDFGQNFEQATDVAIQSDGKIVAAGSTKSALNSGDGVFAVARYNTNGSLDTSFDTDGKVTTDFGSSASANAIAIQSDGKIVAAGSAGSNFAFARYNTNGGLDTTFEGDGRATIAISPYSAGASAMVIQPDGKIVATGGGSNPASGHDFIVVRVNTNGTTDTTFDGDGIVVTNFFFFRDGAAALALQADGRIVAAGRTSTGSTASMFQTGDFGPATSLDFAVARYNTNGSLDTTFDGDGKLTPELFYMDDMINGLGLQSDGKIVAAGTFFLFILGDLNSDFRLARYTPNGGLDTTFGTAGRVSTDFSNGSYDFAAAVAVLPDDRILVAGYTNPDNFNPGEFVGKRDFAIARYNPDGSPDTTFDTDGKLTTDFNNTQDEIAAMLVQPDGKIVVGGTTDSKPALVRYNSNGQLDASFGSGGRVIITAAMTITEIARQADGKIIAAGFTPRDVSQPTDLALTRYNSNGSLDNGSVNDSTPGDSFGTNGLVTTSLTATGLESAGDVVIQPDGRILVAGGDLLRYNADGSPDMSFDGDGKATTNFGIGTLALQSDGKIMAGGVVNTSSSPDSFSGDFALARFNTNGQLDTTFCTGGPVFTDFFGGDDVVASLILQPDGKPVLGGYAYNGGSYDFALARFNIPTTPTPSPSPAPATMQFTATSVQVQEDCTTLAVTVTRSGDTSSATSVRYSSADVTALQRTDYTLALGTLTFASTETQKTINLLISEDSFTEGTESFTVSLSNPTGGNLGTPATITIQILDDVSEPSTNAIDVPATFVCQQYHDLLYRHPEAGGLQFYLNILAGCQSGDNECIRYTRGAVVANFFRSPEMSEKGLFVSYLYMVTLGHRPASQAELAAQGQPPFERPHYLEFMTDLQSISDPNDDKAVVSAKKDTLTSQLLARAEIQQIYGALSNSQFVAKLEETAGVTLANRNQLIADLDSSTRTRAQVLRLVAESAEVRAKFYMQAFITLEYFGLLRRNPDLPGYIFHNDRFRLVADPDLLQNFMVRGFIESPEYRGRFGL
jgi:uncharacterized delta-60 repeat protein